MKNTILKPTIYLLIFLGIFLIGCNDKKDNTTTNLLALYLFSGDPTDTTNLNTPLGRASATANVVSSISANSTTSSNSGNFTMRNPNTKQPLDKQLLAAIVKIYQHGKDPVVAKEEISKIVKENFIQKANSTEKILTAWSSATSVNGRNEYTYSGTLKGRIFEKKMQNIPLGGGTTCPILTYFGAYSNYNSLQEKGTAVFTNGLYSVSQSNILDYRNKADVVFNDFGTLYTDEFAYYKELKKSNISLLQSDCAGVTKLYEIVDRVTKPATVNGALSFESSYEVASSPPNIRFYVKSKANSNGFVITQGSITTPTLVIENLSFDGVFDLVNSGTTVVGTVKVTISGKINGDVLTESLTITL
ncbi:hypothetical protein EHQ46_12335 [Leptospira yanagawae]|uniref:Lipoprotein n=1 Tax=Leptospira yanagawae TaxID=293069 RepID=A0ABY2M0N1_9LEPT|nr:hypothetical protein [Leptospira yanagawae]TGL20169.1 hypothetical protein EHQ46_12335 [Leptospira yanagawae]